MLDGQLPVETRGALVQYVLQRFGIDEHRAGQCGGAAAAGGNLQALKGGCTREGLWAVLSAKGVGTEFSM